MNTFSKKEAITSAWRLFKKRPWFLIGLFLITVIVAGILESLVGKIVGGLILTIVEMAVQILISMGFTYILLGVHDGKSVGYQDIIAPAHLFWKYLGMAIIVMVIVIVGLILLVVPGIIAAIGLGFAQYLVIDKGFGPIEAVKKSWELTRDHRWNLFLFLLLLLLLNIVGAIALLVGLLVTIPVSTLASIHVYRWLLNNGGSVERVSAQPPLSETSVV